MPQNKTKDNHLLTASQISANKNTTLTGLMGNPLALNIVAGLATGPLSPLASTEVVIFIALPGANASIVTAA